MTNPVDCPHLCCDQRSEPHREHARRPVDCPFCADAVIEAVCPNYPATCRGCEQCRTDDDHEPPCVCDCGVDEFDRVRRAIANLQQEHLSEGEETS